MQPTNILRSGPASSHPCQTLVFRDGRSASAAAGFRSIRDLQSAAKAYLAHGQHLQTEEPLPCPLRGWTSLISRTGDRVHRRGFDAKR
jgi:hypothetical protein